MDQDTVEQRLPGGFIAEVVRVNDTVRRSMSPNAAFVHRLLNRFERYRWPGAPRFLGIDEQGREILSFLDGHVAWEPTQPESVSCEASLIEVARLVRQFHDLTAGTDLAGNQEVACHNDLSPKNTIYTDQGEGLRPMALIDWDLAAPGQRVHDVAHVCWQYVGLGPSVTDPAEASRRVRLIADAYDLDERSTLVDTIVWWQDRCWRGIEAGAEAGEAAMVALRRAGGVRDVRAAHDWTIEHRDVLRRALA